MDQKKFILFKKIKQYIQPSFHLSPVKLKTMVILPFTSAHYKQKYNKKQNSSDEENDKNLKYRPFE